MNGLSCNAWCRPWRKRLADAFYTACDVLSVPTLIVLIPLAVYRIGGCVMELNYLYRLSLYRCKPGSRKDAVPMVPDNTDRLLAYIQATRRREPNTMDWEKVRRRA